MPSIHPRTPVIVGGGQISNRVDRGAEPLEPVDMMAEALRQAEAESGVPGLLGQADSVRAISTLSWRYRDPARLVADRLDAADAHTAYTVIGGNYVQTVMCRTAQDIMAGRADLVLLCGAEAWRTNRAFRSRGERPPWTVQGDDAEPGTLYGEGDPDLTHPTEAERGIAAPVQVYPIFENALRAAEGLSISDHRERISRLWSRMSEVAAANPHAWIRRSYTPEEIATPSPENRMIGWPYTKLMNSNNAVEQAAGVVVCSYERARSLGVDAEQMVFLHSGAEANDHWYLSERADLHSSPALRAAGREVLEGARTTAGDLAHIDVYSCFPSAVQVAAREMGLGLDRQLTVTGGMSFAGGPWNNYVMHAIATMIRVLREDPGSRGLVTANGGYLTKHALVVYSTDPPPGGCFHWSNPQEEVDALPRVGVARRYEGPVEIESYTVMHDRSGTPEQGPVACRLPDGRRAWGVVSDPEALAAMCLEEHVGRRATLRSDGALTL